MKRFWVFVIICVVALGVGFTVFRFMTKEEIFYVNQTTYEINSGDNIVLDIVRENLKAGTEISVVSADPTIISDTGAADGSYNFKANKGGKTVITVSTNRSDLRTYTIEVTVGDGSAATPYLIRTQEQLAMIGKNSEEGSAVYGLNKNYKLVANINLTGDWTPIAEGSDEGFTGSFDFNGKKITNINVTGNHQAAGLFAKIGTNGYINSADIGSINISSSSQYAGALAGVNLGTVEKAVVKNAIISNNDTNAIVGGVVGLNNATIEKTQISESTITATGTGSIAGGIAGKLVLVTTSTNAIIFRSSAKCSVHGTYAVGGIVGQSTGSIIENCYAGSLEDNNSLTATSGAYAGGVVGILDYAGIDGINYKSYIGDTYSVMKFSNTSSGNHGAIIGQNVNMNSENKSTTHNIIYGNYYSNEVNENVQGIYSQVNASTDEDAVGVFGDTTANLMKQNTFKSFKTSSKQYMWQFSEGVWSIDENRALPKLDFNVSYISSRVSYFVTPTQIKTVSDFIALSAADPQLVYTLCPDSGSIDLIAGENYTPFDFNGKLTCDVDQNNLPLYTINLTIKSDAGVVDGVAALFKTLGSNAQLSNIRVNVKIEEITTAHHVATFAGYSEGAISNCYVSTNDAKGTLTTNYAGPEAVYIGGLVAENKGKISDSRSYADITYTKSPSNYYVGGIAAYSTNTVQNSNNYGNLEVTGKAGAAYVGGILGHTGSEVLTCANYGKITGEAEASGVVYAGIVGYVENNNDANVKYCANYADVYGSNVGGVVGTSLGSIEYCYNKGNCTGKYVGGLAYEIKLGYMKNSMTDGALLYGLNESSIVCGAVYKIDVTTNHSAYCEYIFTSANFGGQGEKYYESYSNIRGDSSKLPLVSSIDKQAFNNSIHVERTGNIKRNRFDAAINWWDWGLGLNTGEEDIQISEERATGIDGAYAVFDEYGYSQSIWSFSSETVGSYIQLRDIAK